MNILLDVGPAFCSEVAQDAKLPPAARFANGDEVEPAIVVIIDCGNSPAALPAEIGKWNAFEMLSVDVAPKADPRSTGVCESEIHPAVLIEVECNNANCGRKIFFIQVNRGKRSEFSFARIEIDRSAIAPARNNKINCAIIVEIRRHDSSAGSIEAESGFPGNVGESVVAVVAPKNVVRFRFGSGGRCGLHRHVQIEIAVVVVIYKRQADAAFLAPEANFFGDLLKFPRAAIVKEMDAIAETNGEISVAVVVEVAGSAAEAAASNFEAGLLGDVGEFALAEIAEQPACAIGRRAHQIKIRFAVAVVVEETSAGAWPDLDRKST